MRLYRVEGVFAVYKASHAARCMLYLAWAVANELLGELYETILIRRSDAG